jgi:hypothetical protein
MPVPTDRLPELRQVALPAEKRVRQKAKLRSDIQGIVAEPSAGVQRVAPLKVLNADVLLPPTVAGPITASNGGGAIGSALPVQLIFWGSPWNLASTNPSTSDIIGAVRTILTGPWMSGLRQYGIRRCNLGGFLVVSPADPPSTYDDDDIEDLIWGLIDGGTFPEPDDPGGRNLYMVFMPPGTTYGPGGIRGKHLDATDFDFPADVDHAWVGFILTNSLPQITATFCHELAEMCTDPELDAWTVTGNEEIADVCNGLDQMLNGVMVEAYWSVEDNACLIPTAYSVRRALKWSGHTLAGKGLRSIQDPIPSLNALIVSL